MFPVRIARRVTAYKAGVCYSYLVFARIVAFPERLYYVFYHPFLTSQSVNLKAKSLSKFRTSFFCSSPGRGVISKCYFLQVKVSNNLSSFLPRPRMSFWSEVKFQRTSIRSCMGSWEKKSG